VFGYEYSAGVVTTGYDRHVAAVLGLLLGVSAAFSAGDLDNNDGRTKGDIDTDGVGVYGSYALGNGVFFDGSVQLRPHQERLHVQSCGLRRRFRHLRSRRLAVRPEGRGHRQEGGGQFISSVGVRYFSLSQEVWTEDMTANAAGVAHHYGKISDSQVDIPLQLKINASPGSGTSVFTPELRLGWTFAAKKPDNEMEVGFLGSNLSTSISGFKARGDTFQVGAGLEINTGGLLDFSVNYYCFDAGSGYKSQNASLGLGFEF
jgi:outer membrane autotransporter protein